MKNSKSETSGFKNRNFWFYSASWAEHESRRAARRHRRRPSSAVVPPPHSSPRLKVRPALSPQTQTLALSPFPIAIAVQAPPSPSPVSRGSIPHVGNIFSFSSLDSPPYPASLFAVQGRRRAPSPATTRRRRGVLSSPLFAVHLWGEIRLALEHPVRASFGPLRPCSAAGTRPCRRCAMVAVSKSSRGRSGSLERTVRK